MKRNKKIVQNLKDPLLRKIRYELRTLLRLEYEKRRALLTKEWEDIVKDETLTYKQRFEKYKEKNKEIERLDMLKSRYPINCSVCGDRMENLVWNPNRHQWRCVPCYEGAHRKFPDIYP
ncbi:MAG: hypothetical protein ACFFB0_05075 [Promethearchaeota archaeon]